MSSWLSAEEAQPLWEQHLKQREEKTVTPQHCPSHSDPLQYPTGAEPEAAWQRPLGRDLRRGNLPLGIAIYTEEKDLCGSEHRLIGTWCSTISLAMKNNK